jgi:glycosyltransferase involved in cell wall biosynthesis
MTEQRPKKLVYIITGLSTGGAEAMLLKVLERLDARFSPHVVSLTTLGEIGPRIASLGIPVEALGMQRGVPNPFAFLRLVHRLKELKPDVVHTWMYHADLLGGLAARLAGAGAVGWCVRNSNMDRNSMKLATRLVVGACARISRRVPDRILSCSETARQAHVDCGYAADRMVVVPNGFDLSRFRPDPLARTAVRSELGLDADAPLVGLMGRFDPQKNHAGFFTAAGLLQRRLPSVRLVLAGNGVDDRNEQLLAMMDGARVRQATHLLGLRSDMPRLMAALDVLASSSSGEAFPNVLGEAMACGVPCVATNVGDSAYIVGDAGRVVPSGDMANLADAIASLLLMPQAERAALGEKARARVAHNFDIDQIVKRYESFYDDLAAIRQRRA